MPFRKYTLSYEGRSNQDQAEAFLAQLRRLRDDESVREMTVTFCGNADQWDECLRYNATKDRLDLGSRGVTGQADVMKKLFALLNQPANAALKGMVNFLPAVTAGRKDCCVGLCNLFHFKANMRATADDRFVAPFVAQMTEMTDRNVTVLGYANQHTLPGEHMQIGGGAQDTAAARALAVTFHRAINTALRERPRTAAAIVELDVVREPALTGGHDSPLLK